MRRRWRGTTGNRRRIALAALVACAAMLIPALAAAHIERASYWPDPAADTAVNPAAGGKVPKARSLASALDRSRPGRTRVVCKSNSLTLAKQDISRARKHGYNIRPHDHRTLSRKHARGLRRINEALMEKCRYHEIQPAVTKSRNNDRVVVMPGLYTEPTARKQPTDDPKCASLKETNDKGNTGAVSYRYQWACPNDQNLIAVLGRKPNGTAPQPPLSDRQNIPDEGPCVRCNFQLEGSGPRPDDVVVDGGNPKNGNHGPGKGVKDVGIRFDRADGSVLRNMTVRHVNEHDIYVIETDGNLLDRFKTFFAGEYGVLTFVEDHSLIQNCDSAGHGDSALYPGASGETGKQGETEGHGPFRYSTEIRFCDMHHSSAGYSGTDGNAVHLDHNNFYDNANGFTTDVFTAPGHPGFPQDSDLLDHNNFFSNNFNPYLPSSDVVPSVPMPVGTGMWIAGGNDNVIRDNHFWNNWRRGAMVFAVPDQFVCGPAGSVDTSQLANCNPLAVPPSTSYRNEFKNNIMGIAPDGSKQANGTDFWWDSFLGNTGNCWHDNTGVQGTPSSVTSSPPAPLLPSNCGLSVGLTWAPNEAELVGCLLGMEAGSGYDPTTCPWFTTPQKPATPAARTAARRQQARDEQLMNDPARLRDVCSEYGKRGPEACEKTKEDVAAQ